MYVNIIFHYFLFNTSAREKQKALGSITEVVQTVKQSRFHIESLNDDSTEQSDKEKLKYKLESATFKNFSAKGMQTPQLDPIKHPTTEPLKPEYASVARSLISAVAFNLCYSSTASLTVVLNFSRVDALTVCLNSSNLSGYVS